MKLSLVTVCLNSQETIRDTINSVLSQDFDDLEYIIFDGGSNDDTLSIIKSFDSRIKLIEGTDTGIYDAINQAIKHTNGDIVGILNSDDFYASSQVLTTVINAFENSDTDAIYGDLHYVEREHTDKVYRNWKSGRFSPRKFKYGWTIPHPTFFVKKSIYEKYGLYDSSFKLAGDYELLIRFLYKERIRCHYIPEVLIKMRNNGSGNGSMEKRMLGHSEDYLAWKKNGITPPFYTVPLKPIRKIFQYMNPFRALKKYSGKKSVESEK